MAKVDTQPPFEAYRGSDPYIFISYSHRDARTVFAELSRLSGWGLNIWYDEGIDPGNEWPKEIAAAIGRCSLFLYFVSPKSVGSVNCRNEVYYTLSLKKPVLCIHLEPTNIQEIDAGLALSIGTLQAVMKHAMPESTYEVKLRRALETLSECKPTVPASFSAPVPVSPQFSPAPVPVAPLKKTSSGSQAILLGAGVGVVLLGCIAAGAFYLYNQASQPVNQTVALTPSSTASPALPDLAAQISSPTSSTPLQPAPSTETTSASPPPLLPPAPPLGPMEVEKRFRERMQEVLRHENGSTSTNNAPSGQNHFLGQ